MANRHGVRQVGAGMALAAVVGDLLPERLEA